MYGPGSTLIFNLRLDSNAILYAVYSSCMGSNRRTSYSPEQKKLSRKSKAYPGNLMFQTAIYTHVLGYIEAAGLSTIARLRK